MTTFFGLNKQSSGLHYKNTKISKSANYAYSIRLTELDIFYTQLGHNYIARNYQPNNFYVVLY